MTAEQVRALLARTVAADYEAADRFLADPNNLNSIWPTPECIPLPRIADGVRGNDWTDAESGHLRSCRHCTAARDKVSQRPQPDPTRLTPHGNWVIPSSLVARLTASAEPEELLPANLNRGRADGPAATPIDLRQPASWKLGEVAGSDDPSIPLPESVKTRCYDNPASDRVAMTFELTPGPDGTWSAVLRVKPGPTREPLIATIYFPDETPLSVVVPTVPVGRLREAVSEPADPLPPDVVPAAGTTWAAGVELD